MALADPQRHRQALVRSLTDDGLEELTLRLVKPEYTDAHRIGLGGDGGVDVFSDHDLPPARAWQCKNVSRRIPWDRCRRSLAAAMDDPHPPKHYTFVFSRPLTKKEHAHWQKRFRPQQTERYPQLKKLDYVDDLAQQLETRPDIIGLIDDGTFGAYVRPIIDKMTVDGINPLATATQLASDPESVADRMLAIGKDDPHFGYGEAWRSVSARDEDFPDQRKQFTITNVGTGGLPRYTMAIRRGRAITELTAEPLEGAYIERIEPWFGPNAEGDAMRRHVRLQLAKGVPASLSGPHVGLQPGTVPDRFRDLLDEDRLLRSGSLELGISEPTILTATLTSPGLRAVQTFTLRRVPVRPGDTVSYAAYLDGLMLSLDLRQGDDRRDRRLDAHDTELTIDLTFELTGERPDDALRGLGVALDMAEADRIDLACHELLPPRGIRTSGEALVSDATHTSTVRAEVLARALALLNARDDGDRRMPVGISNVDLQGAGIIGTLLEGGEARQQVEGAFALPLRSAHDGRDLDALAVISDAIPTLCGAATNLRVEQTLEHVKVVEVTERPKGYRWLKCQVENGTESAVSFRLTN